jgi:hypothetical protein
MGGAGTGGLAPGAVLDGFRVEELAAHRAAPGAGCEQVHTTATDLGAALLPTLVQPPQAAGLVPAWVLTPAQACAGGGPQQLSLRTLGHLQEK